LAPTMRGPRCCARSCSSSPVYFGFGRAFERPAAIDAIFAFEDAQAVSFAVCKTVDN